MGNKATDKDYLLRQLHLFEDDVLENKYTKLEDIAPEFSTSTNYAVGDYVSYEGSIYKCTTAHSAGAWVAGDFTQVVLTDELGGGGSSDITDLAAAFSTNTAYAVGDYVTYNDDLYRCTTAHAAGAWAAGDFTQVTVGNELKTKMATDGSNAASTVGFGGAITIGTRKVNSTVGTNSFVQGIGCEASDGYSHAEGQGTTASGDSSHTEGYNTEASGNFSHAEGHTSQALNEAAHAEGYHTAAFGNYSHAEGYNTEALANYSHAEGGGTVATGDYSHTEGCGTTVSYDFQHASGKYNNNKSTTLFEIGNGTADNARSNAFEVYSDGAISQDDGTTKFKFTSYNNQDGYYDASGTFHIFGTKYMETTITLSTSASTIATFTNAAITDTSVIEVAAGRTGGDDTNGGQNVFPYENVTVSVSGGVGTCEVKFPKFESAISLTVRIYIK